MSDERRITRYWLDVKAEYNYWLEKWHPVVKSTERPYWMKIANGDIDWALRTAAHYGLAMPTED